MSEARVEQQQPASGAALLVLVGLGIAFALLVALLAAAKTHSGPIYGEANMLYTALVLYAGAATLYMGYGVTGIERYVSAASLLTVVGFAANTAAVAHRWSVAGRPPFSNMYEMLLSFVWTLALLTLIAERAYKVKIIGSITMPITVVSVILMQLLPSDVRPLVPALQSTWLQVHVTLAMLSYAACAVSFALAMMFLIQDNMETESFQAHHFGGNDCDLCRHPGDPFPLRRRAGRHRLRSGTEDRGDGFAWASALHSDSGPGLALPAGSALDAGSAAAVYRRTPEEGRLAL